MIDIINRGFDEMSARDFHDIAMLRSHVFVVEQDCVYQEIDGRDTEPTTRHMWTADDQGPTAYIRLVQNADGTIRIGRVVTRADQRGQGLSGQLIREALATTTGPAVLDAQSHLADWYTRFGFQVIGSEYIEDGIPHMPMRLDR